MRKILFISLVGMLNLQSLAISQEKKLTLETTEELNDVPLQVQGTLPSWLEGTFVRNGPVVVYQDGKEVGHWFDGPAMLVAFQFHQGNVSYSNRFLKTNAYDKVVKEGSMSFGGFESSASPSFFKRLWNFLFPPKETEIQNANVNVWRYNQQFVALTETPLPVRFDLKTLDTLGVFDYKDKLPKNMCFESAHPHADFSRKESINYLVEYGRESHYLPYRIKDGSETREVIGKIKVERPSYMHSFALTENYVIFVEFPLVVNPLDFITENTGFIQHFKWKPELGTPFTVVSRKTGAVEASIKAPPFFAFHHVNAYEKGSEIILDIVTYPSASIITGLAHTEMPNPERFKQSLMRYHLVLDQQTLSSEVILNAFVEFPRINEKFDGKPYQFLYIADARDEAGATDLRPLYKINPDTREMILWSEPGCWCGEPIFVPAPESSVEDDGVVLAIINNAVTKSSFLLILDGKSFQEIARAEVPSVVPRGLHGQFFD